MNNSFDDFMLFLSADIKLEIIQCFARNRTLVILLNSITTESSTERDGKCERWNGL
jgi:hypothetical protein